jgi:hypothetical protein
MYAAEVLTTSRKRVLYPSYHPRKQLREENDRLKRLLADLTLDRQILQEDRLRKAVKPSQKRRLVRWRQEAYQVTKRPSPIPSDGGARAGAGARWCPNLDVNFKLGRYPDATYS